MLDDLLKRLFDNSRERLVNTLLDTREINPDELDRLRELIDNYREEHKNG